MDGRMDGWMGIFQIVSIYVPNIWMDLPSYPKKVTGCEGLRDGAYATLAEKLPKSL
jgi:hypothetical protein